MNDFSTDWFGEFKSKRREDKYQESTAEYTNIHNRIAILVAGLGYWLVGIADITKLGLSHEMYFSVGLRTFYLALCLVIHFYLKKKTGISTTRSLSFLVTISNTILILSVIYLINPDGQIDTIDQITVPLVTILFYLFMYIPLYMLVINGIAALVFYTFILIVLFDTSGDNIINVVIIMVVINFMGIYLRRSLNQSYRNDYVNKAIIEELNENLQQEVEERKATQSNLEVALGQITDSVKYAQKIQFAMLPSKKILNDNFIESGLMFRPKDIVSGDFYWLYQIENKVVVAVADCTGHGVPGALMSVLGISILNDLMKSHLEADGTLQTGNILNQLRDKLVETLSQSNDDLERRDGMDMALIIIDKDKQELQFSGAYSPLWYIQNEHEPPLLTEMKGDRMPIGLHTWKKTSDFSTQVIKYKQGDVIVLLTDGYRDQFGGMNTKKMLDKPMRELFLNNHSLSVKEQFDLLEKEFDNWKGALQQVDDVTVLAIKL